MIKNREKKLNAIEKQGKQLKKIKCQKKLPLKKIDMEKRSDRVVEKFFE